MSCDDCVSATDLASTAAGKGASLVGVEGGPTLQAEINGINARKDTVKAGIPADGVWKNMPSVTDRSSQMNAYFAGEGKDRKTLIGAIYDTELPRDGGTRIGASTIQIPQGAGIEGVGRASKLYCMPTGASPVFAVNTDAAPINPTMDVDPPGQGGVVFSDLFLSFSDAKTAGNNNGLAFKIAGAAYITRNLCIGAQQLVSQIDRYIDQVRVERNNISGQPAGTGYAIDLNGTGDGCVVTSNLMGLPYDDTVGYSTAIRPRTARFKGKLGSTMDNMIGAGDHMIDDSDGIETFAGHFEYGKMIVKASQATLRNHSFWMHGGVGNSPDLDVSPVEILNHSSLGNFVPSIVHVEDCGFIYQKGFLTGGYAGNRNNITYNNDPTTGFRGQLSLERVYRKTTLEIGNLRATKYGITLPDAIFNTYSHIGSHKSTRNGTKWEFRDTLPALPVNPQGVTSVQLVPDLAKWAEASGTYYYKAQFLYDPVRRLGVNGWSEKTVALTEGGGAPSMILDHDAPRCMIRMYRGTTSNSYSHYVDVPMMVGFRAIDYGTDIGGYEWISRTPGPVDAINNCSMTQFDIAPGEFADDSHAYGNVHVKARSSLVLPTTGSFNAGDFLELATWTTNGYVAITGYRRLTTGTGHVDGTDWLRVEEQIRPAAASSGELLSATAPWNATYKRLGRMVLDVTLGKPLWASGNTATATWKDATGAVVHTPS